MSWEEFKKRGVYKFKLDKPHVAFRDQIEKGVPFQTPSGQDRNPLDHARADHRTGPDAIRLRDPGHPEMDRAVGVAQQPEDQAASPST
jgi:hypothetical protein